MECPECGMAPMGEACYHICPNSVHYYTAEQERYDDLHGYNDQYDGWGDPELADPDEELDDFTPVPARPVPVDSDDIPF